MVDTTDQVKLIRRIDRINNINVCQYVVVGEDTEIVFESCTCTSSLIFTKQLFILAAEPTEAFELSRVPKQQRKRRA